MQDVVVLIISHLANKVRDNEGEAAPSPNDGGGERNGIAEQNLFALKSESIMRSH